MNTSKKREAEDPGKGGVTSPPQTYRHAVDQDHAISMMMGVQSSLGEVTGELKHVNKAIDELKQKFDATSVELKKSITDSVETLKKQVDGDVSELKQKVHSLSLWRAAILGGAAVLGIVCTIAATLVHEFKDDIHLGPQPAAPTVTPPANTPSVSATTVPASPNR